MQTLSHPNNVPLKIGAKDVRYLYYNNIHPNVNISTRKTFVECFQLYMQRR